jgi:hypothetical protein
MQAQLAVWFAWVIMNPGLVALWGLGTVAFIVLGAWAAKVAVVRMPSNYFLPESRMPRRLETPGHYALHLLKNLLGLAILAAGVIMLFTPGPGILAMLAGLSLLDFPGKRQSELWLVSRPQVIKQIQRMRRRAGRPPLELP